MKRFGLAVAALAAGSLALSACGNAEKEKQLQASVDSCTKEKTGAEAKATELTAKVDQMQKEMDAMKAAAAAAATPAGKPGAKPAVKPATVPIKKK